MVGSLQILVSACGFFARVCSTQELSFLSHLREMDSESTYLSLCSDAHFHQSPVVDQLEFKQTSCSNPHQDLGQIEIQFFVSHVPFSFMIPRTSLAATPEGRLGMSDVSPLSGISGLSFDSTLLSPLLFFCLVLLPFLSYRFLPAGPFFSTFSRKFFNIFR